MTRVSSTPFEIAVRSASGRITQGRLWEGPTGATRDFWNKHLALRWENARGDWSDRDGVPQGSSPYASATMPSAGAVDLDVTALVRAWLSGIDTGALLRASGGQVNLHARGSATPPTLSVTTDLGAYACPCTADTYLHATDETSRGEESVLKVDPAYFNGALQFDLSAIRGSVASATMTLTVDELFGSTTVEVMRLRPPVIWTGDAVTPELGLAHDVIRDAGLEEQPGVFYRQRFADDSWRSELFHYGPPQVYPQPLNPPFTISDPSYGADPSLDIEYLRETYQLGQIRALNCEWRFVDGGEVEPDEAYARYYVMLEDDWESTVDITKAPGFHNWTTVDFDSGERSTGANGWSARAHIGVKPTDANPYADLFFAGNYVYHLDQSGGFGDTAYVADATGRFFRWGNFCFEKMRWYCVEQRVRMNTVSGGSANHDGALEQWVNGVKVFSRTDMRWRTTTALKIQMWYLIWYAGGTTPVNATMHFRIADLVIADRYIGPKRMV
jgi:hypothetical protein